MLTRPLDLTMRCRMNHPAIIRSRRGFASLSAVGLLVVVLAVLLFGAWALAVTYRESLQLITTWYESP